GGTADRNRSHWSTSKTPSYTKSVSWQHHRHCLLITLLISRLFHCAAKCRIIQQEYDTKTSKMFQSSHKMFQFVNSAELFSPQNGQGNTH
ncbi:hypothetical protein, partial [Klebsiella pneumoniae]|uniref:hypothetical protein n=1 Tax=Klebsiella pneumoniae TaxID=573 RepID=UPI003CECACAD